MSGIISASAMPAPSARARNLGRDRVAAPTVDPRQRWRPLRRPTRPRARRTGPAPRGRARPTLPGGRGRAEREECDLGGLAIKPGAEITERRSRGAAIRSGDHAERRSAAAIREQPRSGDHGAAIRSGDPERRSGDPSTPERRSGSGDPAIHRRSINPGAAIRSGDPGAAIRSAINPGAGIGDQPRSGDQERRSGADGAGPRRAASYVAGPTGIPSRRLPTVPPRRFPTLKYAITRTNAARAGSPSS